MNEIQRTRSMAVFCDFENIALGARDAKYAKFDMAPILDRLLLRGNLVVRKAYCDWDRYKEYKRAMHEASFELIEIPHVRQSGKNSADIRMVVDALDLCYTKPHLDTFVIISGDSDFSPLVAKLRENDRLVVGVGVRQSTSDLLSAICDEFIFYDDLVREREQPARKRRRSRSKSEGKDAKDTKDGTRDTAKSTEKPTNATLPSDDDAAVEEAIDWVVEIARALLEERGDEEKVWGSMVKQTLRRRRPGFNERAYGFATFGALLEEAEARGAIQLQADARSGGHIIEDVPG
ncbi:MAG TPA: NYN domain-containing protein [Pseudomonadales bacterium]|nr:NYN domain-containing protein [Pseudomonadales bacterium]